jgi:hypothetical protein
MGRDSGGDARSLEARLRAERARGFVGRAAERVLFASALQGAFAVLWVHGPGGIGKSALLERFADDAADRPVVRVDGRAIDPTAESFAGAASAATHTPGAVLLVDTFERCGDLEEWFRLDFLPRLPGDATVVVASRRPPGSGWRTELGWDRLLEVIALRNLPPGDAVALLDARGVPYELRERLLAFAGGHPLALSLAAKVPRTDAARGWDPGQDVIETLLSELVGAVPSAAHRHALEICAHAYDTTEELLREALGAEEDAAALFGWLREQPFVEAGPGGLFPHDVVRDALDADLRWRDPQGYEAMHRGIRHHLLRRAGTAHGPAALRTLGALSFLHRHGGVMPDFITWQRQEEVHEDDYRATDRTTVLALAAEAEGQESARIVDFWLSRQPSAFRVHRRPGTDEPLAFMAWLRLTAPDDEETAADPVVAAAWEHSRSAAPIRSGEHLALARFMVNPAAYQRPSPVTDLVQMRILSEWLRAGRLAWSYIVVADPKFWAPQMDYLDQHLISGAATVGGRSYRLYAHDWRAVSVEPWLDRHVAQELFGPQAPRTGPPADLTVLSREEFDAAVRDALRAWHRPDRLAANPLARSRLAAETTAEPAAALRQVLTEAVEALARDPRSEQLNRAMTTTYFRGVPTQEAAAARLGLPLGTYRRHLARGLEQTCDLLWSRELYGTTGAPE